MLVGILKLLQTNSKILHFVFLKKKRTIKNKQTIKNTTKFLKCLYM